TVNVTINATASTPVAGPFTTTVAGNTTNNALPLSISGPAPTSVAVYSNPANASATPSGTNIYFSPTNGWSGQTSLQYTASNAAGTSAPATATINVRPRVGNVTATVTERVQTVIPLSPQTNYTSLALIGYPKGDAYISGSNLYYNAYAGTGNSGDYFVYQATSAGGTSDSGQIYITINPPAPVNHNPVATVFNVNIAANSYAYFNGLANASDPDGDPLTLLSVTPPLHGSAWTNSNNYISYVPAADWSGTDGFYYTVSDGRGGTAQAAVNVYVSAPPANKPPTANPGTTDPVWQSTTVYVDPTTNDTDPDGDALTVQSIDNFYCAYGQINGASACPSNIGSVSRSGNTLVYSAPFLSNSGSPGSNYAAIVVWYTINDGHGHTAQSYQVFNVYGPQ
ncbi:Ig-like domain-containing protein, partial [Caulobacter sp. SSI4214]|uniref:Ig-like domain-containing protein n=1 Tax=Caulobacter sp. SSI4214 TaxID=2575739 RepID=UPI00143B6CAC